MNPAVQKRDQHEPRKPPVPTTWQPAAVIRFTGPRFEGASAAPFDIASELAALKSLLVRTAEALWRSRNASRARLPKGFADLAHMRFREASRGGVVTVLERSREITGQQLLIPLAGSADNDDFDRALELVLQTVEAAHSSVVAARDTSAMPELPAALPREVVPLFGAWCRQLGPGEHCELSRPGTVIGEGAVFGREERLALLRVAFGQELEATEQVGSVPRVGEGRFELYTDLELGEAIEVPLREEHEALVAMASREHERVLVRGIGQFAEDGRLVRFVEVDAIELAGDPVPWGCAEALWDGLPALSKTRPGDRYLDRPEALPDDINVYIYGVGR
jgi:hypothetical protein